MYQKMLKLTKSIIKQSYTKPEAVDDTVIEQLKALYAQSLRTEAYGISINAKELYLFFVKLKKAAAAEPHTMVVNKLMRHERYQVKLKTLSTITNPEVLELLINEYYKNISLSFHNNTKVRNNMFNILPLKNVVDFISDLYVLSIETDNSHLYRVLFLYTPVIGENGWYNFFNMAVKANKSNILAYIWDEFDVTFINNILGKTDKLLFNYLNYENQKNLITKILTKIDTLASYQNIFSKLVKLPFNDHSAHLMTMMINWGLNIDFLDSTGFSALHWAVNTTETQQLAFLLQHTTNLSLPNSVDFDNVWHIAARTNNLPALKLLIETKKLLNVQVPTSSEPNFNTWLEFINAKKETALSIAIANNHSEFVKELLAIGADVNHSGPQLPPILMAAQLEDDSILKQLTEHKSIVLNVTDKDNLNALHYATKTGMISNMKYLVSKGFTIDDPSYFLTYTPLHIAIISDQDAAIAYLVTNGAKVNAISYNGYSPFQLAIIRSSAKNASFLAQNDAHIHTKNFQNRDALHLAVFEKRADLIDFLVNELDFSTENRDNYGYTPLELAVSEGYVAEIKALAKVGANVNIVDNAGYNLIHKAIINGRIELIETLVAVGVDINYNHDNKVYSPMEIAISYNNLTLVQTLINLKAVLDVTHPTTKLAIKATSLPMQQFIESLVIGKKNNIEFKSNSADQLTVSPIPDSFRTVTNPNHTKKLKVVRAVRPKKQKTPLQSATTSKTNKSEEKAIIAPKKQTKTRKSYNYEQANGNIIGKDKIRIQKTELENLKMQAERKKMIEEFNNKQARHVGSNKVPQEISLDDSSLAPAIMSPLSAVAEINQKSAEYDIYRTILLANFASDAVHIVCRCEKLDHKGGRPGFIISDIGGKYTILLGSSQPPKDYEHNKYIALKLSESDDTITYFSEVATDVKPECVLRKWNNSFQASKALQTIMISLVPLKHLISLAQYIITNENGINKQTNKIEVDTNNLLSATTNKLSALGLYDNINNLVTSGNDNSDLLSYNPH